MGSVCNVVELRNIFYRCQRHMLNFSIFLAILDKLEVSGQICITVPITELQENPSSGSSAETCGRTDGHTWRRQMALYATYVTAQKMTLYSISVVCVCVCVCACVCVRLISASLRLYGTQTRIKRKAFNNQYIELRLSHPFANYTVDARSTTFCPTCKTYY
jgi:hypothetical protein